MKVIQRLSCNRRHGLGLFSTWIEVRLPNKGPVKFHVPPDRPLGALLAAIEEEDSSVSRVAARDPVSGSKLARSTLLQDLEDTPFHLDVNGTPGEAITVSCRWTVSLILYKNL